MVETGQTNGRPSPGRAGLARQTLEGEKSAIAAAARRNSCFLMRWTELLQFLGSDWALQRPALLPQMPATGVRRRPFRSSQPLRHLFNPLRISGSQNALAAAYPRKDRSRRLCRHAWLACSDSKFLRREPCVTAISHDGLKTRLRRGERHSGPQTERFAAKALPLLRRAGRNPPVRITPPEGFERLLRCGSPTNARRPSCARFNEALAHNAAWKRLARKAEWPGAKPLRARPLAQRHRRLETICFAAVAQRMPAVRLAHDSMRILAHKTVWKCRARKAEQHGRKTPSAGPLAQRCPKA